VTFILAATEKMAQFFPYIFVVYSSWLSCLECMLCLKATHNLSLDSLNSEGISYELISLEGLVLSLTTGRQW